MERIQDYAIIGDCRSAALVSREGSIDWLCWPRFDSPSIFGRLLDDSAGCWRIAPAAAHRVERRYLPETNVLETRFITESASLRITDLMPVASEEDKRRSLMPDHEILRLIECEGDSVDVEMRLEPRPDYGRGRVRIRKQGDLGLRIETDQGLLVLRTDAPVTVTDDGRILAAFRLHSGESFEASLTFTDDAPAVLPPLGDRTRRVIDRSIAWWRRWASHITYSGPMRDAVIRSALVLKLLVFAPSGAVVAAPTASLPERLGADLNWDYRYCWLRDAAFTVRALFGLGMDHEATAFVSWLLYTTRLTKPRLRILYDVHGQKPKSERRLGHLSGYFGSRPVRVGNAAVDQLQLDVYGEVLDAATQFVRRGGLLDRETREMLISFGTYVCRNWQRADEGIWEPRSGRKNHTHSRVLCWAALDRLLDLNAKGYLPELPTDLLKEARTEIRREVEERGWNASLESYVAELDGDDVDASLLRMAWYGFEEASSERMRRTHARIRQRLGAGDALLYRYLAGDGPREGAFGICSFWEVEFLALGGGSIDEAQERFREVCNHANDVGLFSEEIDPGSGGALGNFPQAFTHVGLINSALSISRRVAGHVPVPHEVEPRAGGNIAEVHA